MNQKILSVIQYFKKLYSKLAEPPTPATPESSKGRKRSAAYRKQFNVAGVTFKCKLNDYFNRQDVLEGCDAHCSFYLQEYTYKKKPALLIICKDQNLDIGSVPDFLIDDFLRYKDYETELQCLNVDFFENEKGKTIYYCKMRFIAYKKEAV